MTKYIAIVLDNIFTIREEGGLTTKEFKLGARIKSINPCEYPDLLKAGWARTHGFLTNHEWNDEITKRYDGNKRQDDLDNKQDRYRRVPEENKYDDDKRPRPSCH